MKPSGIVSDYCKVGEGLEIREMKPGMVDDELLKELAAVATMAFGTEIGKKEMAEHLGDGFYVACSRNGNGISMVAGFASYEDRTVACGGRTCSLRYLSGAFVHPDCQGNGLYRELLGRRTGNCRSDMVFATRTQNPVVARIFIEEMERMGYATYPLRLDGNGRFCVAEVPEELEGLAGEIAEMYGGGSLMGRMYDGQLVRNYPSNDCGFSGIVDVGNGGGVVLFAVPREKDLSAGGNYSCGDEDTVPVGRKDDYTG